VTERKWGIVTIDLYLKVTLAFLDEYCYFNNILWKVILVMYTFPCFQRRVRFGTGPLGGTGIYRPYFLHGTFFRNTLWLQSVFLFWSKYLIRLSVRKFHILLKATAVKMHHYLSSTKCSYRLH